MFWKRGLFTLVHLIFLKILENLYSRDSRGPSRFVENKRESDHVLETLDSKDSRDSSSEKKTPFVMTPFSGPEYWDLVCQLHVSLTVFAHPALGHFPPATPSFGDLATTVKYAHFSRRKHKENQKVLSKWCAKIGQSNSVVQSGEFMCWSASTRGHVFCFPDLEKSN